MLFDGAPMLGRAIARMLGEAVVTINLVRASHHPISRHLGDDRSGSNGEAARIALDDSLALTGKPWRYVAAIDQDIVCPYGQGVHGTAHGIKAGAKDVLLIDMAGAGRGD